MGYSDFKILSSGIKTHDSTKKHIYKILELKKNSNNVIIVNTLIKHGLLF